MNVTIDVKILAFVLVAIALIVLIVYCVKFESQPSLPSA